MSDESVERRSLVVLRAMVDTVDREILQLLVRRMGIVSEVAGFKRKEGLRIRDFKREREVLDDRRTRAEGLGLAPDEIESLFRVILRASRDYQASLGVEVPVDIEPKTVAVIGGRGGMGQCMSRLMENLGHHVLIADLETELTPTEAAGSADVVIVSVPIDVTVDVVRELGPQVRTESLLMDVTSIKEKPLEAMLESTSASVLGTHPMFGPGVHSLQGQRVVVCPGRGEEWQKWVVQMFCGRGLTVTEASAEEHDRAMAVVQVLTHFQTQVLGWALSRLKVPLESSLKFTSPAYLMELYVAGRHFAQSPALYGAIEMLNPRVGEVTEVFAEAARELGEILADQDQDRFAAMFEEVRAFFGSFTEEALEQSSYVIDRLVERS